MVFIEHHCPWHPRHHVAVAEEPEQHLAAPIHALDNDGIWIGVLGRDEWSKIGTVVLVEMDLALDLLVIALIFAYKFVVVRTPQNLVGVNIQGLPAITRPRAIMEMVSVDGRKQFESRTLLAAEQAAGGNHHGLALRFGGVEERLERGLNLLLLGVLQIHIRPLLLGHFQLLL